jgi:arylsulfatase A-like enzyme
MINRRDFLKLLTSYSLLRIQNSIIIKQLNSPLKRKEYPNILILVLDALSGSRMSLYGCDRNTTPNIDKLAENATVYHRHYSSGNFTSPGTASLLTGTYPWYHRCFNIFGSVLNQKVNENIFNYLPKDYFKVSYTQNPLVMILLNQFINAIDLLPPMEETSLYSDTISKLFQKDFKLAYWSETIFRGRDIILLPSSILFLSFVDEFQQLLSGLVLRTTIKDLYPKGVPNNSQGMYFLLEDTIDWVENQISTYQEPFFSYIHLWPPHEPYFPHKDFIGIYPTDSKVQNKPEHFFSAGKTTEELINAQNAYDEFVYHTDFEIGCLLNFMRSEGFLDNTILIITSDHGQAFERGIEGHHTPGLYESLIRIPLIISIPGQNKREDIFIPTSAVDILPTLLEITGQPIPNFCEGMVLPSFCNKKVSYDRSIFIVEAKENSKFDPLQKVTLALIKGDYKLIRYLGYEGYENETECYNLAEDPNELENLYPSYSIAQTLKKELDNKLFEVNQPYLS